MIEHFKFSLSTPRLLLREFQLSDALVFFELNSDPEVMRFTGDLPFNSLDEAEELIRGYKNYGRDGYGRWTVECKGDGRIIGWCGLKRHDSGIVDLGFRFFREEWGKGYATEAARACVDYGLGGLGLSQIIGRTHKDNTASIRVLEKCGMEYRGLEKVDGLEEARIYTTK